jgi:phosphate transport system permease protein
MTVGGLPSVARRSPRRRKLADRLSVAWMVVALLLAVVPLVIILVYVVARGVDALSLSFLTEAPPFDASATGGGYFTGIQGTIKLVLLSSVIAIPVGIAAAVYLNEYGRGSRLAPVVRFVADLMTGVPSIFIGIFVFSLLVEGRGYAAWKGAIALSLLMVPIVTRGAEEVLRLVPRDLREASLALGVPRWRTVVNVVLPAAASGLTTISMLAVARAAGETAPLLFTSFGNRFITGWTDVTSADSALPLLIFRDAGSAYDPARQRAWAGALVLISLVLILTILARVIATRGPSLSDQR